MPDPRELPFAPPHVNRSQVLDDPNEVFDLVDANDQVIGHVRRGAAHRDSTLIHRSVQILIFTSSGQLLLQRRSAFKDLFPGYYCASASGHVASGEDYDSTAKRELAEELGIIAPLTSLGKALIRAEQETEFTALYVARSDGPYQFHPTETDGGEFFTMGEVYDRMQTGTLPMTPALRVALMELQRISGSACSQLPAWLETLG
jgi:isopentenyl-diphosphate delta-isomerase type 1